MRTIIVVPYDNTWVTEFEKIKQELSAVLEDSVLAVEHVGSTSVEGLYAKPIIDIDIIIDSGMFPLVVQRLNKIGYEHVGDLGIVGREVFKYSDKKHLMQHHLYVCEKDSAELKRHIAFRNFLRTHKEERDQYSKIKIEMAQKYPHDIDSYIAGKQPVILEIYKKC